MNLIQALYDLDEVALIDLLMGASASANRGVSAESCPRSPALDVSRGKFHETPLMVATALRSTRVVRMVLGLVPEHVNVSDVNMTTALALASRTGNVDKVRLLLEAGAPSLVYYADGDGVLPIMHAINKGHMHLLRVLVKAMVQLGQPHLVTGCAKLGGVLLDVIKGGEDHTGPPASKASVILVEEIKQLDPSALSKVLLGSLESVVNACLVAREYDVLSGIVSAPGMECAVPKMVVRFVCGCGRGCSEEVDRVLLGLAACVGPTGGLLRMPGGVAPGVALLTVACQRQYPSSKMIQALLEMGAMQIGPEAASTAMLWLLRSFNRNPTLMLRNAELDSRDCTWTSPDFLNCINSLLDAGADVTTADGHGLTALHYAALSMNVEVLVFLLSGCLVKARDVHHAVLENPSCAGTLPVRTQMARYTVDIDGMLRLLAAGSESLPWAYDPSFGCIGCYEIKLKGVLWVLEEWRRGSPPDMALHMSTIFNKRGPDGTLQFGACRLSHLHGTVTSSMSHDDPYVSESEESGGLAAMDGPDAMGGQGRGLEGDEPTRRHWYTSFV